MKTVKEFLAEGKYQQQWKRKPIKVGKLELVVNDNDVHSIVKNGKEVATFAFDSGSDSFWVTDKTKKGQTSYETIDDIVKAYK